MDREENITPLAKEIIEYPVKIPSSDIEEIKQFAKDVINGHRQTSYYCS